MINSNNKQIAAIVAGASLMLIAIGLVFAMSVEWNKDSSLTKDRETPSTYKVASEDVSSTTADNKPPKIDERVTEDGVIWRGFVTTTSDKYNPKKYELWRIGNDGESLLVGSYSFDSCDSMDWDLNSEGGVDMKYVTSPCEAFADVTNLTYDAQGKEIFRMQFQTSQDFFTFKQDGYPEYKVKLLLDGNCTSSLQISDEPELPAVILQGVTVTSDKGKKEFKLDKPGKVNCQFFYGEIVINPYIETPVLMDEVFEFTLPNNVVAFVSLASETYAQVDFKKVEEDAEYLTYVKSNEDSLQYCNGADMDSEGFKKTITNVVTTDKVIDGMTQSELAKATVLAATSGMCNDVLKKTDVRVEGDTAYIGQIDVWAGVSIVMCSCKPEIEVNLLRLPGISNVVFE